ncbi:MAG: sodium/proton-translocating pyrophosphatase, partial [Bacteroidetes bacterium]|nr:sodium/proton-translocating pyrophosphatase [Bacteroidota bacterium]
METQQILALLVPAAGIVALAYAFLRARWVIKQDVGTDLMAEIAENIAEGARAFLKREYRVLFVFVASVAALLALVNVGRADSSWMIAVSFVTGAVC